MRELRRRVQHLADREAYAFHDQLDQHEIDLYRGAVRFARPHDLIVHTNDGDARLEADRVVIACGTKPLRPRSVPFDGRLVFDADEILALESLPHSLVVVGAGRTGIESAILLALLGVQVTVVEGCDRLLEGYDRDVVDALVERALALGMRFELGQEVIGIDRLEGDRLELHFANGRRMPAESVLYAAGRVGNTAELDLSAVGLEPDDRGRLWCNADQKTWAPHIFGAGDVVGFPVLAGSTIEQGRRAACHAFGYPFQSARHARVEWNTIPTVAMVGRGEEQLAQGRIPFETSLVRLRSARSGALHVERAGLLKLVYHRATRALLGVHAIGDTAGEIVRIAESILAAGGTLGEFCRKALASPAAAGSCKGATIDDRSRLRVDLPLDVCAGIEPHIGAGQFERNVPELAELIGS
jgi:NAD(P) transhydrogenase